MEDVPTTASAPQPSKAPDACLRRGGEMGARMRALDWSQTPVGPVVQWPQSLKTAVQILLGSRYPMFVWWGRTYTNLYNDAYAPILGGRHPHALGQSAPQVWADVWEVVGPQAAAVLYEGRSSWNEERLLIMERYGYPEETYFTFSYSPVADDTGGVGGVFCAVTEDTTRVLDQRRLRTLRELAASTVGATDAAEVCRRAATVLSTNPYDLPFVLLYLFDDAGACARLAGTAGVAAEASGAPPMIDLRQEAASPWPLRNVIEAGAPVCLENLERQVGVMPGGPCPASPSRALLLPLVQAGQDQLAGVLIAGVSPLRPLDEEYHGFCGLVATSVATAITDARAYEAERQRAEALVELDRAKTTFFSNISHEFRTPLTLMLGPLEQMLEAGDGALTPSLREELLVVHRNGLRLLKLVNTLLDFARIEAGRIEASYEPLDLAACTADLASVFRAAIERAGLRLVVDCPPLPEAVYVDREMWEKIVLNLLANAIKFTFAGEIAVRLQGWEDHVVLTVQDTGTGIPAHELPHLFERFYRIRDVRARTHEGTGIGLALVQELVHLHSGEITVASEVDVGTTFTITIPTGTAHLPADRVGVARCLPSTALGAEPYVEEALYWQPVESEAQSDIEKHVPPARAASLPSTCRQKSIGGLSAASPIPIAESTDEQLAVRSTSALASARILLADDNADMRAYVQRLLSPYWLVEAVADGLQALTVIRERLPNLVLADVMMPSLDGLSLLRTLRADSRTATIPVILLSARAGEASRVEGLEAGADDYLVKPFSARELLARVEAQLNLARLRDEMQVALRDLNTTLAQRVAERTADLEQAHEALRREMAERQRMHEALFQQEKLAALGTLLANVAHELNNPLAVASMQLDTLHEAQDTGAWSEDLEILRQAVERCQSVVQSFLSLARQHEPTRQAVALHTIIGDVLVLLERALETDGIAVERHLADDLPNLWADPHQLHHILANLLTNAHHALRQIDSPRHLRLTAAATADRSQVILEVADSGPGIPQEVQRRIFEPFFTTKPQGMGSGLGLPLCRSIVESHGGTIQISSQLGHGTTVSVTLPVAAPEMPLPEAVHEPEEPAQWQRGTILLIDDEPGVQRALQRLLQRSGHEITTATNGQEALAALEARTFEVILCDMHMPDLDGPGFYREVERRYPHLQSRVVFLTGDVLSPEAQDFFAHVDRPRLVKPFRAQKVRQVIQQVLTAQ